MSIQVRAQLLQLDGWRATECSKRSVAGNEPLASDRRQFANCDAVAGHDEAFARVECAHDLAAVVAQFALGEISSHSSSVALVLQT